MTCQPGHVRTVVFDLEATCWDTARPRDRMEIIEIGAVRLDPDTLTPVDEFATFVRPVVEPQLSQFCTSLTTITQEDVDTADVFGIVFPRFVEWLGDAPLRLCSWGAFDLEQLTLDCQRHGYPLPECAQHHVNLKSEFAAWRGVKRCGMASALEQAGLPLVGTHHRGIDDARNLAGIARLVLPSLDLA